MREYTAPRITIIELKSQEAFATGNCLYVVGSCPVGDGPCWTNQTS